MVGPLLPLCNKKKWGWVVRFSHIHTEFLPAGSLSSLPSSPLPLQIPHLIPFRVML